MVCSMTLLLHTLHFFCFPSLHIFLLVFLCSPFPPSFSSSLGMGRYFFVEQIFTTAEPRVMIPLPLRAARNDRGDTREIILQPLSPPARTNTRQGINKIWKVSRKSNWSYSSRKIFPRSQSRSVILVLQYHWLPERTWMFFPHTECLHLIKELFSGFQNFLKSNVFQVLSLNVDFGCLWRLGRGIPLTKSKAGTFVNARKSLRESIFPVDPCTKLSKLK